VENSTHSEYAPTCLIQRLVQLEMPGTRMWEAGRWRVASSVWWVVCGMRQVVGSGWWAADNMISVYITVWNLSLARPLRRNVTMPLDHGVDNCSLRFCRNGRPLDLGESRSPTEIFQQNLLLASHRLWAYVCAFVLGLMVVLGMVMMAMVMVSVMVITVPEALRQVGWLCQC